MSPLALLNTFNSPMASPLIAPLKSRWRCSPPGSLRLADLGYFSLTTFAKLSEANVFWIARLKVGCSLFDTEGEPFCLQKWLKTNTADTFETDITIGKKTRLKARIVAQKLSEQETQKRRRDIRRRAKRKNATPSKARLQLAGWNIYITNIGADLLTPEQITGYRTHTMAD